MVYHSVESPVSEITVPIGTPPVLKESLPVHQAGGEQHLGGEQLLLTEVTVEDREEDKEGPDHHNDHHLLLIVQLVSDLAGLRFDGSEVRALVQPLSQVTHFL